MKRTLILLAALLLLTGAAHGQKLTSVCWDVTCPAEVKEVSLYNAAGLLLGKTPVVNGKAQMQGAKGLNIVSFDGANAVKVIL